MGANSGGAIKRIRYELLPVTFYDSTNPTVNSSGWGNNVTIYQSKPIPLTIDDPSKTLILLQDTIYDNYRYFPYNVTTTNFRIATNCQWNNEDGTVYYCFTVIEYN